MTQLLTAAELSTNLGIPRRTLDSWRWRGIGPEWIRVGRHIRYAPDAVERWIAAQSQPTGPAA